MGCFARPNDLARDARVRIQPPGTTPQHSRSKLVLRRPCAQILTMASTRTASPKRQCSIQSWYRVACCGRWPGFAEAGDARPWDSKAGPDETDCARAKASAAGLQGYHARQQAATKAGALEIYLEPGLYAAHISWRIQCFIALSSPSTVPHWTERPRIARPPLSSVLANTVQSKTRNGDVSGPKSHAKDAVQLIFLYWLRVQQMKDDVQLRE